MKKSIKQTQKIILLFFIKVLLFLFITLKNINYFLFYIKYALVSTKFKKKMELQTKNNSKLKYLIKNYIYFSILFKKSI